MWEKAKGKVEYNNIVEIKLSVIVTMLVPNGIKMSKKGDKTSEFGCSRTFFIPSYKKKEKFIGKTL